MGIEFQLACYGIPQQRGFDPDLLESESVQCHGESVDDDA
jgi:hypothetical protein